MTERTGRTAPAARLARKAIPAPKVRGEMMGRLDSPALAVRLALRGIPARKGSGGLLEREAPPVLRRGFPVRKARRALKGFIA